MLIPSTIIPRHESRDDVFEITFARKSEPQKTGRLYTTHLPHYPRAYLDLFQTRADLGEQFLVKEVRAYDLNAFCKEFNLCKPEQLGNTRLAITASDTAMEIDEAAVTLASTKLRTYQGQVIMEFGFGMAGRVKITKEGNGFSMRLGDHSRVTQVFARTGKVMLVYHRTLQDPYPHRRIVSRVSESACPSACSQSFNGEFSIESKVGGAKGLYVVHATDATRSNVAQKLGSAIDVDDFRKTKGDIAEEIARQVLGELGFDIIADHPLDIEELKPGSSRIGPDFLIRERVSRRLYYLEVKWWYQVENALVRASKQVMADLHKSPELAGAKVHGAYVMLVDWNSGRREIRLQFQCVAGLDEALI